MQLGRLHLRPTWKIWLKGWWWVEPLNPLYSDMVMSDGTPEPHFSLVRSGWNRIARVTKMLELGFVSQNEARHMLGYPPQ